MRKRKGFSMIEMVATAAMLSLIVLVVIASSASIDAQKIHTRDTVYLSVHNVNCMERLRQEALSVDHGLQLYYSDEELGSLTVETIAEVERTTWDHFNVYKVKITSKMRDSKTRLISEYVLTDIGGTRIVE